MLGSRAVADPHAIPTPERLCDLIRRMDDRPVVVLADLVVDRFISGTPKRISREAPVLILRYDSERITPGGGANAVANIAALGGRPLTLGIVGDDASGQALLEDLRARGVGTDGILVRPGYRTPTKTRILGGAKGTIKQQIVRYDVEDRLTLDDADRERLRTVLDGWLARAPHPGVAVLSDYGYGAVDSGVAADVRRALARVAEGVILLDSRFRLGELKGVDGATPNEEEAEALYGGELAPAGDDPDRLRQRLHRAATELRERLGMRFLLITRGSQGMVLALPHRSAHLPVHGSAQVADVTGAGDTVIGTFALAVAAGANPLEAALLADYAGGVVVMKMGTATLTAGELEEAVHTDPIPREELRWVAS